MCVADISKLGTGQGKGGGGLLRTFVASAPDMLFPTCKATVKMDIILLSLFSASCIRGEYRGLLHQREVQRLIAPEGSTEAYCTRGEYRGLLHQRGVQRLTAPEGSTEAYCTRGEYRGLLHQRGVQRLTAPEGSTEAYCTRGEYRDLLQTLYGI